MDPQKGKELIDAMNAGRLAMTAATAERRQQQAAARWVALGGSETGLAKINVAQFLSLNERQQQELVKSMEGNE